MTPAGKVTNQFFQAKSGETGEAEPKLIETREQHEDRIGTASALYVVAILAIVVAVAAGIWALI